MKSFLRSVFPVFIFTVACWLASVAIEANAFGVGTRGWLRPIGQAAKNGVTFGFAGLVSLLVLAIPIPFFSARIQVALKMCAWLVVLVISVIGVRAVHSVWLISLLDFFVLTSSLGVLLILVLVIASRKSNKNLE